MRDRRRRLVLRVIRGAAVAAARARHQRPGASISAAATPPGRLAATTRHDPRFMVGRVRAEFPVLAGRVPGIVGEALRAAGGRS